MEPRDVLLAQLERLRQELGRAASAIDSPDIDAGLRARVVGRLDTELERLGVRHEALVKAAGAAGAAGAVGQQPIAACWRDLGKLQVDCARVFDECLAFVQGAWARAHDVDEGLCSLTDSLLDDVSAASGVPWERFTLVGTSEVYRETAGIIRIKYPEVSLWSMPLAAHELGHFCGPELRTTEDGQRVYPLQKRLAEADATRGEQRHSKAWFHLQEYFADVFAAYTLGPAYAAAFVLLRLRPDEAHLETFEHPSGAARVHAILLTLEAMNDRDGVKFRSPLREIAGSLRTSWEKNVEAAGQPSALPPAQAALAAGRAGELFAMLTDATPQALGFGRADWLRVEQMAGDLAEWLRAGAPRRDLARALPEHATRRDVLNAAWLARLQLPSQDPYAVNDIARNGLTLYRSVAAVTSVPRV